MVKHSVAAEARRRRKAATEGISRISGAAAAARKKEAAKRIRDAFADRTKALPDLDRDGGLVDGPGVCRVDRARNPKRVPDFVANRGAWCQSR